ncbi:MAG: hypothetical protein R3C68_06960 [Myxococcota bacterium]
MDNSFDAAAYAKTHDLHITPEECKQVLAPFANAPGGPSAAGQKFFDTINAVDGTPDDDVFDTAGYVNRAADLVREFKSKEQSSPYEHFAPEHAKNLMALKLAAQRSRKQQPNEKVYVAATTALLALQRAFKKDQP